MSIPKSMMDGGLYLITPPRIEPLAFAPLLAEALNAAPVAAVQIRLKSDDEALWEQAALAFAPIARAFRVTTLMTDRCALAKSVGCDGVQLTPQGGIGTAEAREMMGQDAVIGVVCDDDLMTASEAVRNRADFVAFGALSVGDSKTPPTPARPDVVKAWTARHSAPSLAMGRIRPEGCAALIDAGATYIAGIGAVWDHPEGPGVGAREMVDAIDRAFEMRRSTVAHD